ncbi:hypothetical protein V8V55_24650 [Priestia megaterium]|uniref:amylo-alpha-1,6-glucosidase n=1 Tax=Priestia megaterium TaxID=1404 RepID=UPI001153547B
MDLSHVPFSYFGSYLSISYQHEYNDSQKGLFIRSLHGKSKSHMDVLKLIPLKYGLPVEYEYTANYNFIRIVFDEGEILICFDGESKLLIKGKGEGVGLRLDTKPLYNFEYNYLLGNKDNKYCIINSYKNLTKLLIFPSTGSIHLRQDVYIDQTGSMDKADNVSFVEILSNKDDEFLCVIQDIPTHILKPDWNEYSFTEAIKRVERNFGEFCSKQLNVPQRYINTIHPAAYVTWSSIVRPDGYLKRYTMYASNHHFPGAWSWDHCFNAVALAGVDNDLAWDQMATLFDYQDSLGQIPGSVSDSTVRWNFTKPPVQGLFFSKMIKKMDFTEEQLKQAYTWVSKQVHFYFSYKDSNEDGICEYHHGNDSGQDNSTVFASPVVIDSPDLTAFLIKAMEMLSDFAERLEMPEEKIYWDKKADGLTQLFCTYFVEEGLPVAKITETGLPIESNSLLPLMSLVIGNRLPEDIKNNLVSTLNSKRYLTEWGVATEAIDSPLYEDDAYWRGAIWGPTTLLLVDALEECGEMNLSEEIADKYCRLTSKNGFAENFNARTGEPLRDRSFAWTASSFLYLAAKLS